jgi:enterochelin esterase-like enzyme
MILFFTSCISINGAQKSPSSPPGTSALPSNVLYPTSTIEKTDTLDSTLLPDQDNSEILGEETKCIQEKGEIHPFSINDFNDKAVISGRIYTPPCYGLDQDKQYPTLYILHGATETDQQWDNLGIDDRADFLISEGIIPPLIIVMPREETWIFPPDNPFGERIIQVLIPWVDKTFQTDPDKTHRAIGGLSRGGNWAVRIGLLHWGIFNKVGAHSTPLFYGDLERLPRWIAGIPDSNLPLVFLDIGQDDNNLADALKLEAALTDLDIPHSWHLFPGTHDDSYWKAHLDDYLIWYSSGWDAD